MNKGNNMKTYIEERAKKIAEYCVDNKATVRQCASVFLISKSTVHKDLAERLKDIDSDLHIKVRKVIETNKAQRHIRGGETTRKKCLENKKIGKNS